MMATETEEQVTPAADAVEGNGTTNEMKTQESVPKGMEDAEMAETGEKAEAEDVEMAPEEAKDATPAEEKTDSAASREKSPNTEQTAGDKAVDIAMDKQDEPTEAAEDDAPATAAETNGEQDADKDESKGSESKSSVADQQEKVSSPKRKDTSEDATNGDDAKGSEPTAKKQKVETDNEDTAEKPASDTPGATPSVIISRDDMAKMEEDSGRLKFEVITNDGTKEHLMQLTTLKNIFAKQLPKMPKEYIVRLVFDRNHRSMLLLKNGTQVIGGICYRPFEKNHFAEIAFCAINASDQVKGYGTRLMNHLKEYVKTKNITYFLTYADNYAIGYFKKQGFTKIVSMPRPNWYGYIKDYDGGTLMECTIHTQINYLRITSMIHMQRKAIQDKIKQRARDETVYPGLTKFADGRLMDIYMVPGVKEAGWSQAVIRNNRIGTRDQGSLKSQLSQLLKAITNHRSAWPFHEPVDTSVVVDYLDHIKEPVDLQLVGKRIESGTYISKAAFKADLEKMCDNCTIYNTPDTNYYKAAVDLKLFIQTRVQIRDHK